MAKWVTQERAEAKFVISIKRLGDVHSISGKRYWPHSGGYVIQQKAPRVTATTLGSLQNASHLFIERQF